MMRDDTAARSAIYIVRRRPVELIAQYVDEKTLTDTWEGPRTAQVGDYVLTGVKGEQWPVPGSEFDRLYEVIGPTADGQALRVRKKVMELRAFQTYEPLTFAIRGENFHAEPGYFIIAYEDGSCYPCEPEVFFETFEVVRPATPEEDFEVPPAAIDPTWGVS